jgi:hypothetical protein
MAEGTFHVPNGARLRSDCPYHKYQLTNEMGRRTQAIKREAPTLRATAAPDSLRPKECRRALYLMVQPTITALLESWLLLDIIKKDTGIRRVLVGVKKAIAATITANYTWHCT